MVRGVVRAILLGLEQEDGTVAKVEVDEVLGLWEVVSIIFRLCFLILSKEVMLQHQIGKKNCRTPHQMTMKHFGTIE